MASMVVDTHAAIWYFLKSPKLSANAYAAMDEAVSLGDDIYIASISLVEIIYLAEKGRITRPTLERLFAILSAQNSGFILAPLDFGVARAVGKFTRDIIPDMPDRIIAATALHLNLPLVTRDSKVRSSGIKTIW